MIREKVCIDFSFFCFEFKSYFSTHHKMVKVCDTYIWGKSFLILSSFVSFILKLIYDYGRDVIYEASAFLKCISGIMSLFGLS